MKITYNNPDAWVVPKDIRMHAIPSGFTDIFKIRPQGEGLMTDKEAEKV